MRAYFFGNMYLSSIQQGIQAAHAISDMFVKYMPIRGDAYGDRMQFLYDWADDHKTMILLNAGYSRNIEELKVFFSQKDNPYPWDIFHEEVDSLNGAATSISIILPQKIYDTAALFRKRISSTTDEPSPRVLVKNTGMLKVTPNNNWGIDTEETLTWNFTDWEIQLIEKLNTFGLAK